MQYEAIFKSCKNDSLKMTIVIFLLNCAQNIDRGYTFKPSHCGGSNEYPQSMSRSKNKKIM